MDTCGNLAGVGGASTVAQAVSSQIKTWETNGLRCMDAVNAQFKPNDTNSPNRCADISDYTGSVTGKHTNDLNNITKGIGSIVQGLLSVPTAIIGAIGAAVTALTTAITAGISTVINGAISLVKNTVGKLTDALGDGINSVIKGVSSLVGKVGAAIGKEKALLADALNKNNPANILLPDTSPCLVSAAERQTATKLDATGSVVEDIGSFLSKIGNTVAGGVSSVIGGIQGALTGYDNQGIPTTSTLTKLNDQAQANIAGGAVI
jgi:hypothetical protein